MYSLTSVQLAAASSVTSGILSSIDFKDIIYWWFSFDITPDLQKLTGSFFLAAERGNFLRVQRFKSSRTTLLLNSYVE